MNLSDLSQAISSVKKYHSQLITVVGDSASQLLEHAAASDNSPVMNLSLELSERLINIPGKDRAKSVTSVFSDLLDAHQTEVLLLDHIEILFDRTLSIEPLKLLQNNAKNSTLVVAWPGKKSASSLTYATPGHPEYRSYKTSDLDETILVDAIKNNKETT